MIRKSINGDFWLIDQDSHISKWCEQQGRLDQDQNMLPLILPHIPVGGTVVDAGAYIGDMTWAFLERVGPTGQVFAFEPQCDAYKALVLNCPKACCFRVALSDQIGKGVLVPDSLTNYGACRVELDGEGFEGYVEMMALDSLVLSPHFIKIDAEGHELRVLKGAVKTIERSHPIMLVEINESALNKQGTSGAALLVFIKSLGYSVENVYPRQEIGGDQFDVICKPIKP